MPRRLRPLFSRPARVLVILLFFGVIPDIHACNVPVFRYALERWPADVYQAVVYHQQQADLRAIDTLLGASVADRGAANVSVTIVDVASAAGKSMTAQGEDQVFPWLEIYYPANAQVIARRANPP